MSVTQVQTTGITDNAVTSVKIPNGAVGTTEIADNAVTSAKIPNGAVGTTEIADDAVTTAKINFETALVPVGGIIMWSGSVASIPTGWRLCNGSNGTPNLQNRFIVGAGSGYAVAATGGSADATLVSHTHTVTSSTAAAGGAFKSFFISINRILKFPPNDAMDTMAPGLPNGDFSDPVGGVPSSSVGRGGLNNAGSSATNANLPPYYALAFIIRVS